MGKHSERLRELIQNIPRAPKGFTPEATMCLTQLANGSLQIISQLEEALEDLEKENASLVEQLLEARPMANWTPSGD